MQIEIEKIGIEQKPVLRNLMELYRYDFSEFDQDDVSDFGLYGYEYIDHYWIEGGRHPFFIKVDDKLAGFVLIRQVHSFDNTNEINSISEFFVMKKYRGKGIGKTTAFKIFDMFSGEWKVAEIEENKPAQIFWRKVILEYTKGNFEEIREDDWKGPIQKFETKRDGESD